MQKEIVFKILKLLNISLTSKEQKQLSKYHTKNFKAFIYFGQAIDAQDIGNWREARHFFKMALFEDPLFQLAKMAEDSCPDASVPNIKQVRNMPVEEISAYVRGAVNGAVVREETLDQTQEQETMSYDADGNGDDCG